jgi:hypothetical protein
VSKSSSSKLTATALVDRLRLLNVFDLAAVPKHLLRCTSGGGEWDYVCIVQRQPGRLSSRAQFGALVDSERVIEVSRLCPLNSRLPAPLNQRTR